MKKIHTAYLAITLLCLLAKVTNAQNNVRWADPVGVSMDANGLVLTKVATTNWTGSGARGLNVIPANADGWVEFTVQSTNRSFYIGFTTVSAFTFSSTSFAHAIGISTNGAISKAEGSNSSSFGTVAANDVFRISREGTSLKYYKNGTQITTASTVNAAQDLYIVAVLGDQGAVSPSVTSSANWNIQLNPTITGAAGTTPDGSVAITPMYGVAPYSYIWSSGETTSTISNKAPGTYTVTVTDAASHTVSKSYNIGYRPGWTTKTNVSESGGILTKTNGAGWDGIGITSNLLAPNSDGWIEIAPVNVCCLYVIGFGFNYPTFLGNDVRSGVLLNYNGTISAYENGTQTVLGPWLPGDKVRVSREGSFFRYYRNGVVLRSVAADPTTQFILRADVNDGSTVPINTSFDAKILPMPMISGTSNVDGTGSISLSPAGGISPYTYSWSSGETTSAIANKARGTYSVLISDAKGRTVSRSYKVGYRQLWSNKQNVTVTGNILTTNVAGTWNAGAISSNIIPANTDGYVEFSVDDIYSNYIIGFSQNDASFDPAAQPVRWGVQLNNQFQVTSYDPIPVQISWYQPGDLFRIAREGNNIVFYKNGVAIRTAVNAGSTLELKPRVTVYQGATPSIVTSHDSKLFPLVTVKGAPGSDSNGSLKVYSVLGGTAPYSYSWASGGTGPYYNNRPRGTETLTVTDAEGRISTVAYAIGYPSTYYNMSNVSVGDSTILKTAGGNGSNAGVLSGAVVASGQDGALEFIVDKSTSYYWIGFSFNDGVFNDSEFTASLEVNRIAGTLSSRERTLTTGLSSVHPGDVLRIAREGSQIKYYRNGIVLRTIATNTVLELRPKTIINSNAGIAPVFTSSFSPTINLLTTITGTGVADGTGGITLTPVGGVSPYTYSWSSGETTNFISNKNRGTYSVTITDASGTQVSRTYEIRYKVTWTDLLRVTPSGDGFIRNDVNLTSGGNGTNIISMSGNGWVEWVHNGSSTQGGFSGGDNPPYGYGSFAFGLAIADNNAMSYWEYNQSATLGSAQVGDVLRVERVSGIVKYSKNGIVLRTTSTANNYELRPQMAVLATTGFMPPMICSVDGTLIPYATVTGTPSTTMNSGGSISLVANGGNSPYTYSWSSGETTSSISNKPRGSYTVTITDSQSRTLSRTYSIGYKPVFMNAISVAVGTNSIIKTISGSAWDSGAISSGVLPANTNGWMEMVIPPQLSNNVMMSGFSLSDNTWSSTAVRYGVRIEPWRTYTAIEGSGGADLKGILPGDVLRIERSGTNIIYYRNGIENRRIATDPKIDLRIKLVVSVGNAVIPNTSFDSQPIITSNVTGASIGANTGSVVTTVGGGTAPYTYQWSDGSTDATIINKPAGFYSLTVTDAAGRSTSKVYNILNRTLWSSITGVSIATNGGLSKGTPGSWGTGANIAGTVLSNNDGWVEFVIQGISESYITGFSTTPGGFTNTSFANGVFVDPASSAIYSYENTASTILSSYQPGDVIRISREGSSIKYYRNGILIRTVGTTSNRVLYIKAALFSGTSPSISSNVELSEIDVTVDNWAFQYQYDSRKRVIGKKMPGADWVYMVYDDRDRLVLMQDGAMRKVRQWQFTKYDSLNRAIMTGIRITQTDSTQAQMSQWVKAFYSNSQNTWGEGRRGGGTIHNYTNMSFPKISDAFQVWTVTYYDDYDWMTSLNPFYSDPIHNESFAFHGDEFTQAEESEFTDQLREVPNSTNVTGLITGFKAKVFDGGPLYLASVNYFDDKGRNIQNVSNNYKLGIDRTTNVLDFTGRIRYTKTTHTENDVSWKEENFFITAGRYLTSNTSGAGYVGGVSGAVSIETLPMGADGSIEVIVEPTSAFRVGFNTANSIEVNYGIQVEPGGIFKITNSSGAESTNYAMTNGALKRGDVLKIERVGSTMNFYKNSTLFASKANVSTGVLMVDAEINGNGLAIGAVRTSFTSSIHTVKRRFEYDHYNRSLKTWHKLDNGPEVLLVDNAYNELGQLVDKNLHISGGEPAKQSIDYRYNIRGWLTSVNGSDMSQSDINLDAQGTGIDLFGFELLYNEVEANINTGAQLFNGNISAMKWGVNRGNIDQSAYQFTYDEMNRLKSAAFRKKALSWVPSTSFSEDNFQYDFNGNIRGLTRTNSSGAEIDHLTYEYGTSGDRSNKLLKVSDAAVANNRVDGFHDGANTDNDYAYDANGNMVSDQNKGLLAITYLYPMNLPYSIMRGVTGSAAPITANYVYDALGRKLNQSSHYVNINRNTDYVGEFLYEDDLLQSVQHEEGKVAMASREIIYHNDGTLVAGIVTNNSTYVAESASSHNGQTYLKLTMGSGFDPGAYLVSGIPIVHDERYIMRIKGYVTSTTIAPYLKVRLTNVDNGSFTDVSPKMGFLTIGADGEAWVEVPIVVPPNAGERMTLAGGVAYYGNANAAVVFINEFEIVRVGSADPEYQYDLKDHLGNVRLSFGTKTTDSFLATYESDRAAIEDASFLRYEEGRLVKSDVFDHTDNNIGDHTGYAQRLSGSANETIGLSKTLSVMPGDVVRAEVYAKYIEGNQAQNNWIAEVAAIMAYFAPGGSAPAGMVIDGASYLSSGNTPLGISPINHAGDASNGAPKAYLNYIFINSNLDPASRRFIAVPITAAAKETGTNSQPHEYLSLSDAITQEGYVIVYLSNDNGNAEVFFDDFKIEHDKSPILQSQDYYPFGLTFNSYSRENALNNQYQYNGKEQQDELSLGWLDYGFRMYQPDLGRFFNIDPHADSYVPWTPYNYVADNPVLLIDPDGRDWNVNKTEKDGKTNYDITFVGAIVNNSNTSAEDIISLWVNISNQIQDSFTMDDGEVSTSVHVQLRVSKDGKTNDNEHVINITDDLDSDIGGDADIGGRTININSNRVLEINKTQDQDLLVVPHEVGHSAGLVHPDEISWLNIWSWSDRDQMIKEGSDNNNVMYSGPYRQNVLKQDFNNGGKGYRINANQAEIIYQNRDNKPKKSNAPPGCYCVGPQF